MAILGGLFSTLLSILLSPLWFVISILAAIFAPAFALVEFFYRVTVSSLSVPSRLFTKFETIYIFCGSAAIIGIFIGTFFGLTSLFADYSLSLNQPSNPHQSARRSRNEQYKTTTKGINLDLLNIRSPRQANIFPILEEEDELEENGHIRQSRLISSIARARNGTATSGSRERTYF